jgi:hypothetical protein
MCSNIKAKNITVITIAFDINDNDTKTRLQGCASSPAHYYEANDNNEVESVFLAVAGQFFGNPRLSE